MNKVLLNNLTQRYTKEGLDFIKALHIWKESNFTPDTIRDQVISDIGREITAADAQELYRVGSELKDEYTAIAKPFEVSKGREDLIPDNIKGEDKARILSPSIRMSMDKVGPNLYRDKKAMTYWTMKEKMGDNGEKVVFLVAIEEPDEAKKKVAGYRGIYRYGAGEWDQSGPQPGDDVTEEEIPTVPGQPGVTVPQEGFYGAQSPAQAEAQATKEREQALYSDPTFRAMNPTWQPGQETPTQGETQSKPQTAVSGGTPQVQQVQKSQGQQAANAKQQAGTEQTQRVQLEEMAAEYLRNQGVGQDAKYKSDIAMKAEGNISRGMDPQQAVQSEVMALRQSNPELFNKPKAEFNQPAAQQTTAGVRDYGREYKHAIAPALVVPLAAGLNYTAQKLIAAYGPEAEAFIKEKGEQAVNALQQYGPQALEQFKQTAGDAMQGIGDTVKGVGQTVADTAGQAWQGAKNFFGAGEQTQEQPQTNIAGVRDYGREYRQTCDMNRLRGLKGKSKPLGKEYPFKG